eukprot:1140537-Pelagomonas_calceolata.AAC.5
MAFEAQPLSGGAEEYRLLHFMHCKVEDDSGHVQATGAATCFSLHAHTHTHVCPAAATSARPRQRRQGLSEAWLKRAKEGAGMKGRCTWVQG